MVIYAKDKVRVSAFYRETLGLHAIEALPSHDLLQGPGVELVIHAIPEPYAADITITRPPQVREDTPFKPAFAVASLIAVRTAAMHWAGVSFTHLLAEEADEGHRLVTDGPYALVRHPSYAGFYLWVLASQLLLGNIVSPVVLVVVMHRFFSERIREEEAHLTRFFGKKYLRYRQGRPSGIPFVP
jgi:hypothetical protein